MTGSRVRWLTLVALLVVATALVLAVPAEAVTRTVRLDGTGDFTNIQAAIDASANGDVVEVDDGTYTGSGNEDIDFGGRLITVRSKYGPQNCILDLSFARAFHLHSGETSAAIIQGFTIEGGDPAGGIGGGILCDGASPTIVDVVVADCYASNDGGGIAILNVSTNVALYNVLIHDNVAGDEGGGIFVEYGRLTMRNCTIDNNQAFRGGGLYFTTYTPGVEIWDNVFYRNRVSEPTQSTRQLGGSFGGNFLYNLVEGTTGLPATNFDGNPAFVTGPYGSHYLGATTSDAVDAGSGLASATCVTTADGVRCMSQLTTRTDSALDAGPVDVGYHYAPGPMDLLVPSAYTTIQSAIDAARPGDRVVIASGTYLGAGNRDLDPLGKAITIRSASGNPATCILDCQGSAAEPHRGFNIASGEGAGTVISGITIRNAFNNNGAGMRISGTSPQVVNCVFEDIGGNDGGGILVQGSANPTIRDSVFRNCVVGNAGGAICVSYAAATISGCVFEDNYARWGGGAIYFLESIGNLSTSVFAGNVCDAWGGAVHVTRAGNYVLMEDCTLDGNEAPQGAQVYARVDGQIDVENCILSNGLVGSAVYATTGGTAWVTCSDVWNNAGGDWVDGIAGQDVNPGNFSADPLYCGAGTGDFSLRSDSPCVAASNPGCGQIGALGVGCSGGPQTWNVLVDGSGDFATIQAAIDAAGTGDVVQLGPGTFIGDGNRDLDYGGKAITVRGQDNGPPSIIQCQGSPGNDHRAFTFTHGEGAGSVLEYVVVTGGHAVLGGAVHAVGGATPTIRHCNFIGNVATERGGAIYASDGSGVDLADCLIADNQADVNGGGVFVRGPSTSSLLRVRFERNHAVGSGGGFYERVSSDTTFEGCAFLGNTADLGGGYYNVFSCEPLFTRCTFTMNSATTRGGAMRIYTESSTTLTSCLLWGDTSPEGPEIAVASSCTLTVDCSDVQGGQAAVMDYQGTTTFYWNANNVDLFPYFCDAAGGDLTLVSGASPCLPTGNSCGVQMGAYEAGCSPPTGVDGGGAPVPVTHLGPARPNPFNPGTEIHYSLGAGGRARLAVYDARGRLVRILVDGVLGSGPQVAPWDGRDDGGRVVGAGVYFYRLEFAGVARTGKMTLLK